MSEHTACDYCEAGIAEEHTEEKHTYRIGRSWAPDTGKRDYLYRSSHLRGLTLEQAQEHCSDPSTRKAGVWFDFYTEDDGR